MKRDDVIQAVHKKMEELGIPLHVASVRKVPSSVECQILLGGGGHPQPQGKVRHHARRAEDASAGA